MRTDLTRARRWRLGRSERKALTVTVVAAVAAGLLGLAFRLEGPQSGGGAPPAEPPRAGAVPPTPRQVPADARPPLADAPVADVADARGPAPGVRVAGPDPPAEQAASAPLGGEARVRVHGRVLRAGLPVAGYDLAFHARGSGLEGDDEDWDFTDEQGRYEVLLAPGSYLVLNDTAGPWTADVAVPGDRDELAVDIELAQGVIRGRVLRAGTGAALTDAALTALRADLPRTDALTQAALTRGGVARSGADGSFELQGLSPGRYLVLAEHRGLATASAAVALTGASAADAATVEGVELVLSRGHTLRGVVRGPAGLPAAHPPVSMELFVHPGARLASLGALLPSRKCRTRADGEFELEGLAPGPYVVFAVGQAGGCAVALRARLDLRPEGPPLELQAERCGRLLVTVSRADGTPLPGATLDLRLPDGSCAVASRTWLELGCRSDADGRIELDDVAPGVYRIAAGHGGRLGRAREVQIRSGAGTEATLVVD